MAYQILRQATKVYRKPAHCRYPFEFGGKVTLGYDPEAFRPYSVQNGGRDPFAFKTIEEANHFFDCCLY